MAKFTSFGLAMTILCLGIIFLPIGTIPFSYAQTITNTTAMSLNANPLVFHLSSSDPWRASIALSDANAMKDLGHNVTLLLERSAKPTSPLRT